ncbi:hypothetical protein [Vibrio lentus]|uniref:hypothetical protein n=1 Tax=Vibrio lentus TaxID=136468 RepID=UPI0010BD2F3E|nr:hypothetical protein [Vibrio lentus]TKG17717.1 hypothetical protein FCW05_12475 [Vibrio lentus]
MNIQLSSWREGFFYASELDVLLGLDCSEELNRTRSLREAEDYLSGILFNIPSAEAKKIVNKLGKKTNRFDDTYPLVTHLKSKFSDEHQLPNSAYQWMEDNLKACAFCYQFLYQNSSRNDDKIKDNEGRLLDPRFLRQPLIDIDTYPKLNSFLKNRDRIRIPVIRHRKLTPNTISDLVNCIKTSFEESDIDVTGQKYILDLVADAWKEASKINECSSFNKWFDINMTDQISWLKEYHEKKFSHIRLSWYSVNEQDFFYILHAEFYHLGLIDLTSAKLFLKEARNGWSQRKFHSKNKGTRSRGISMSERTNQRLDWLAKNKDNKINAVIKELIDREYENMGGT